MTALEVIEYRTADGTLPFARWIERLADARARVRILARIDRMRAGLRGDWRSVGDGVFELRVDVGPGYRIYCGQDGATVVLLLCGGDKRSQSRDIEVSHAYWKDYKERYR
jgi:putative addiction module killer protein